MAKQSDKLMITDRVMSVCGSVNFKDYTPLDKVILAERMCNLIDDWNAIRDYYFIFHDETDTFHLHYIFCFHKQQYVSNILNRLTEGLCVENEAVNYRKLLHRNAHLRYLLHIDNQSRKENKKEFSLYEMYSNVNTNLIQCFLDSKDDNNKLDMITLEGICVQCEGREIKVAEFLDDLYDKNYRKIKLILDEYSYVRDKFNKNDDLPF